MPVTIYKVPFAISSYASRKQGSSMIERDRCPQRASRLSVTIGLLLYKQLFGPMSDLEVCCPQPSVKAADVFAL